MNTQTNECQPLTKTIFGYRPVYTNDNLDEQIVMVLRIEKGTLANVDRTNVVNIMNATYRAKSAIVHGFYSVYNAVTYAEGYATRDICFELGEILEAKDFDMVATNQITSGIWFYTNKLLAEHLSLKDDRDVKVEYNDNKYDNFGNGIYKEAYPNGQTKCQIDIEKGKYYGAFTEWYSNGQLKTQGYYKNDLLEGPYTEYYKNGQVSLKCHYVDDNLNGPYTQYFSNGQVEFDGEYLDDEKTGLATEYNNVGEMTLKAIYKNDKVVEVLYAKPHLQMSEMTDNQSMVDAEFHDTPIKTPDYQVIRPKTPVS
jgi:antitoxin component YwqK of YwqJK toxin-antitoxin module